VQERGRLKKDLDKVMSDKDVLGTQLVRRNDELALLYEKIRLHKATIMQGNAAYRFVLHLKIPHKHYSCVWYIVV
jgi:hypothetical protein